MPVYTLTVNGTRHTVDVDADTPLLWVLRDDLGLTGTKYSCGVGICGSCAVIVNGSLERSCVVPVSAVDGAEVMTIEGLSSDRSHPLQRAWILLESNPDPSDEDIDVAMNDFLCRCGTYQRIREAIHRAAKEMNDV